MSLLGIFFPRIPLPREISDREGVSQSYLSVVKFLHFVHTPRPENLYTLTYISEVNLPDDDVEAGRHRDEQTAKELCNHGLKCFL